MFKNQLVRILFLIFIAGCILSPDGTLANPQNDGDTDITNCFIDLELDLIGQTISGGCTITATSLIDGLNTFILDLRDNMTVNSVIMSGNPTVFGRVGHTVVITLDKTYNTQETFEVKINYDGSPENLAFSSFEWDSHNGTTIVSTLGEPWFAHSWWPCKETYSGEQFSDMFTADIWITVPDWMVVGSNGLLQGTDTIAGDKLRYRWHESYPITTYLVAFTTTDYLQLNLTYNYDGGSMPVDVYYYSEDNLATVEASVSDLVSQIETFSKYYGQYPFINEKYGLAKFRGGASMEHQTMTFQTSFYSSLNAHELAHQWWGNMVTCRSWHDIWLHESFATWSEALYQEKKPGGTYQQYLNRLAVRRPSSYSGSVYVYNDSSTGAIFNGNNVYRKGAWVVHMLRHVLGDQDFFDTLKSYLSTYEGDFADTADFQNIAESVSGEDLNWFFDQWIYGTGAPFYRYGWEHQQVGSQHQVLLHIEQYQSAGENFIMPIDITVTTGSTTKTFVVWQQQDIDWFVLPVDGPVIDVQFDKDTWILRGDASKVSYEDLSFSGPAGGPFTVNGNNFNWQNPYSSPINYQVATTATWLDLSDDISGTLEGFTDANISVQLKAAANSIPEGIHQATIYFTNLTDSIVEYAYPVIIKVGEPVEQYSWNMDIDPAWTMEGQWAWGIPAGQGGVSHGNPDPAGGYTGNTVLGYNLAGDYSNSLGEEHLTSTDIDCTGLSDVHLRFYRWLNVEKSQYDNATVLVSNNGVDWVEVWHNNYSSDTADSFWQPIDLDISAIADNQPTVYLRWTMGTTDSGWTYSGWNIDDLAITSMHLYSVHGDLEPDGDVDLIDYTVFTKAWNSTLGDANWNVGCDLHRDDVINLKDLSIFMQYWLFVL